MVNAGIVNVVVTHQRVIMTFNCGWGVGFEFNLIQ